MIAFIVPVKSKKITTNWTAFSYLVNRCINSICNQIDTDFKVIVACHDIPLTDFKNHDKVTFLKVDFDSPILKNNPSDLWLKRTDKGKKIKVGVDYAKKIGADYVMTVDSDDCISNRISSFVNKNYNNKIHGWFLQKGYLYPEGKKYSYLNLKNFNTLCGSCVIIKPEIIDFMYGENYWFDHERTNFNNEISLKPLPFPGAMYSMLNGSNIRLDKKEMKERSKFNPFKLETVKTLFRRVKKYRIIPLFLIKNEFSIYFV